MVAQKESAWSTYTREVSEGAIRYKDETGAIFARHERDGLPPSQIYPYPDDVIIDLGTGEVTTDGPMSKEQAGAQKVVMGDMMKNMSRFFDVKKALTQDPSNMEPRREFKGLNEVISFYETYSQRRSTRGGGNTVGRKVKLDDKDDLVRDNLREKLKEKGLSLPQIKSGCRGSSRC